MTTRALAFRVPLPVRPLRLTGTFLAAAATRVPAHAAVATGALLVAANLFDRSLPDGALVSIGSWSVGAVLGLAGFVGGVLSGLIAAAERTLRTAESDLQKWFEQLPRDDGERLFPSTPLESLRQHYDTILDRMFNDTIGRFPMPGFARRLVRSRYRHAMLDEFFAHCERTGASVVGFSEVRDFLVAQGLPLLTAPAHAQFRLWNGLILVVLGALFTIPSLIGLLAGIVAPIYIVAASLAAFLLVVVVVARSLRDGARITSGFGAPI